MLYAKDNQSQLKADIEAAFVAAYHYMRNRIAAFAALPLHSIEALRIGEALRKIGQMEGATSTAVKD